MFKFSLLLAAALAAIPAAVSEATQNLTLRAGVIAVAPYAMLSEESESYVGLTMDLIEILKEYAMQDDINLEFDFSNVANTPTSYNEAVNTVSTTTCEGDLCDMFDIILGDIFMTKERIPLVTYTPSWLNTYVTTAKSVGSELGSMAELNEAGNGTYCIVAESAIVLNTTQYPNVTAYECPTFDDCIAALTDGTCSLFVDDVILLETAIKNNGAGMEVTGEQIGETSYIGWIMRSDLDTPSTYVYMSSWMNQAISDGKVSELIETYIGTVAKPIYPTEVVLNAGVIYNLPYAVETDNTGLFFDILAEVIKRAMEIDGITLDVITSVAPSIYNDAVALVSDGCEGESCLNLLMADTFLTTERNQLVTYMPPYQSTNVGSAMLVSGNISSMDELNGENNNGTYCIVPDSAFSGTIYENYPNATAVDCGSVTECFDALIGGNCTLYVDDILLLSTNLPDDGSVKVTDDVLSDTNYIAWPLSPNLDPAIYVLMNKYIYSMVSDGTITTLLETYFGEEIADASSVPTVGSGGSSGGVGDGTDGDGMEDGTDGDAGDGAMAFVVATTTTSAMMIVGIVGSMLSFL